MEVCVLVASSKQQSAESRAHRGELGSIRVVNGGSTECMQMQMQTETEGDKLWWWWGGASNAEQVLPEGREPISVTVALIIFSIH